MLARVSSYEASKEFHRLPDAERLEWLRSEAEKISRRHAAGQLTTDEAVEELRQLTRAGSNTFLSIFGL